MPNSLEQTVTAFAKKDLHLHVGAEIEFYITGESNTSDQDALAQVLLACAQEEIPIYSMEEEEGKRQYEIALQPCNPSDLIIHLSNLKNKIIKLLNFSKLNPLFYAKHYKNMPGCGLHFHVSLYDASGKNIFAKPNSKADEESTFLQQAVGGLLQAMAQDMIYFAPHEEDYARYCKEDKHAPTHICWGSNNRTAAIRIPTSTLLPEQRHIEHRLTCANADPYPALCAILQAIYIGIDQKLVAPDKIYGNAFDQQYNLQPLPQSLKEAIHYANNG